MRGRCDVGIESPVRLNSLSVKGHLVGHAACVELVEEAPRRLERPISLLPATSPWLSNPPCPKKSAGHAQRAAHRDDLRDLLQLLPSPLREGHRQRGRAVQRVLISCADRIESASTPLAALTRRRPVRTSERCSDACRPFMPYRRRTGQPEESLLEKFIPSTPGPTGTSVAAVP